MRGANSCDVGALARERACQHQAKTEHKTQHNEHAKLRRSTGTDGDHQSDSEDTMDDVDGENAAPGRRNTDLNRKSGAGDGQAAGASDLFSFPGSVSGALRYLLWTTHCALVVLCSVGLNASMLWCGMVGQSR